MADTTSDAAAKASEAAAAASAQASAAGAAAADAASSGMNSMKDSLPVMIEAIKDFTPIFISLLTKVSYLGAFACMCYFGYQTALSYWVETGPNEWLLIIRNGNLKQCKVGLCTWLMPGDQHVKFPSLLNKVNFSAQQVTLEMQGVEVTGMIVWTVNRVGEGPFVCYKSFGTDLCKAVATDANAQLQSMAISIIRDRIANLSLDDVLKNRSKLRNGVKEEMQKLISGWGIWLETCEIQDVKVSSRSLFSNLQTEFREKSRMDAEKIAADTQNTISQEKLVRDTEYNRRRVETETKQKIFSAEQTLKVQTQEGELYTRKLAIEAKKKEAENQKRIREEEMQLELEKKRMEFQGQNEIYQIKLQIDKQKETDKLNTVKYEAQQIELDNKLKIADKNKQQELAHFQKQLAIKEKGLTPNVLKAMVLETTESIYKNLNISEMKVVNMNGGGAGGSQDPAGQLIGQVMASVKSIGEQMDTK